MPKSTKKTQKPVDRRILKEVSNTPSTPSIRTKKNVQFSPPSKLSFNTAVQNPTFQKTFNVFSVAGFNDESRLNQNVNANVNQNSSSHSVPIPVKTSSNDVHQFMVNPMSIVVSEIAEQTLFHLPFSGPSSSLSVPVFLFPQNNSTSASMIAKDNVEQTRIEAENFNPDAPLKLDTPFFSKESMITAVSRGSLPSPAYLAPIVQRYHDLAANYADADGCHPQYLEHHYGGENHLILLHFPVTGLDVMMKANKDGTLFNATMNYLLYILGPTFLSGLVCDVYPFKAPPDCKGKKWFQDSFGSEFVKECEAISLDFILAVSRHSAITKFVSMGKNPHRLMKSAQQYLPASHSVLTTCCHPHSAIQWGIDLEMARNLDQMASLITGLPIRSQENHYNNHRDEFDAVVAGRKQFGFGGPGETEKQRNVHTFSGFGGANMTQNQKEKRMGGAKMSEKQEKNRLDYAFGGPKMTELQYEGRRIGGSKPSVRQNITPDMVSGKCSGCGRAGLTKKGRNGNWSQHRFREQDTKKMKHCGYYYPT